MSIVQDEYESMLDMQDSIGACKYPLKDFSNIGRKDVRRLDGLEKASGRALYTMDIQLPGILEVEHVEGHGDVEKNFAEVDRVVEFAGRKRLNTSISPEQPCGVVR